MIVLEKDSTEVEFAKEVGKAEVFIKQVNNCVVIRNISGDFSCGTLSKEEAEAQEQLAPQVALTFHTHESVDSMIHALKNIHAVLYNQDLVSNIAVVTSNFLERENLLDKKKVNTDQLPEILGKFLLALQNQEICLNR